MKVYTVERPYALVTIGGRYRLSSEEAGRLLDGAYPILRASENEIILQGADSLHLRVVPATLGGGPAFRIERQS